MATYKPLVWNYQELKAEVKPVGIRKYHIKGFHFPYFDGTLFEFDLYVNNFGKKNKDIHYRCEFFRLPPETQTLSDAYDPILGDLVLESGESKKTRISIIEIPQPGNYLLQLVLQDRSGSKSSPKGNMVRFAAFSRDVTTWDLGLVLLGAVVGAIVGGVIVWILGGK